MGADLSPDHITAERAIFIQDELPPRQVTLTSGFEMAQHEVTNAQYEAFDPAHAAWRGKAKGLSSEDREAVVYVGWDEVVGFCRWLSEQDRDHDYRLPTEAEWEYACRAGTRTAYNDGVEGNIYWMNPLGRLAKRWRVITDWFVTRGNRPAADIAWGDIEDVDLTVGQQGPNAWGLYDMHGNVEEWTQDWYGPYVATDTVDPVGYVDGVARVVRGGSHGVHLQTLRSANRSASLVSDKHFLLGLPRRAGAEGADAPDPHSASARQGLGEGRLPDRPTTGPLTAGRPASRWSRCTTWSRPTGRRSWPGQFAIPLYTHNHSPSLTWAANGDVLMVWFTGESEKDQALTIPALRGPASARRIATLGPTRSPSSSRPRTGTCTARRCGTTPGGSRAGSRSRSRCTTSTASAPTASGLGWPCPSARARTTVRPGPSR